VGGRQQLCINDAVRALGSATLVNDRCNQLLDGKLAPATGKRQKGIDGTTKVKKFCKKIFISEKFSKIYKNLKKTRCGCAFARASAIETLSDHILADSSSEYGPLSSMVAAGRDHDACMPVNINKNKYDFLLIYFR
jgi:hypothetical protein